VNASVIAAESGIILNEIKSAENKPYTNLLQVICESGKESISISGAVFGKSELRIVEVDGFPTELKPEGDFILYRNVDRPGVLAGVTRLLAEEKINIGTMSLGRNKAGKEALTIIHLDAKISDELKKNISLTSGVKDVRTVHF
jgi:D-3-phosphoglycerate dehydrogenase